MEVVSERATVPGWSEDFTCLGQNRGTGYTGCGRVLRVKEEDLYLRDLPTSFGYFRGSVSMTCCACGEVTDDLDVPMAVRRAVEARAVAGATEGEDA